MRNVLAFFVLFVAASGIVAGAAAGGLPAAELLLKWAVDYGLHGCTVSQLDAKNLPLTDLQDYIDAASSADSPILLRGMLEPGKPAEWSQASILAQYGSQNLSVGNAHQLGLSGVVPTTSTLEQFARTQTDPGVDAIYSFDRTFLESSAPGLLQSLWQHLPAGFHTNYSSASDFESIFFWGGAGTGLPLHQHDETWALLTTGQKLWVFHGPNSSMPESWLPRQFPLVPRGDAHLSTADYMQHVYPKLTADDRPLLCVAII